MDEGFYSITAWKSIIQYKYSSNIAMAYFFSLPKLVFKNYISQVISNELERKQCEEEETHVSIKDFRKGNAFSIPSILARDCTNAIGIMKKKVRKKNATATISLLIDSET